MVIVLEGSKCPAHHLVAEMVWPIESCDSAGEFLPHAKMLCSPRDLFSEINQA
jgi:hypothetical protein